MTLFSLCQQEMDQPEGAVFYFLITSNDREIKDKMASKRLCVFSPTSGFGLLTVLHSGFILRRFLQLI